MCEFYAKQSRSSSMQQASDNREGEALSRQEITGEGDLILTPKLSYVRGDDDFSGRIIFFVRGVDNVDVVVKAIAVNGRLFPPNPTGIQTSCMSTIFSCAWFSIS